MKGPLTRALRNRGNLLTLARCASQLKLRTVEQRALVAGEGTVTDIDRGQALGLIYAQGPGPKSGPGAQAAVGTAFTYQGLLASGESLVNGDCDFQFRLWDDAGFGSPVGVVQEKPGISVADGRFTVQLDFGTDVFRRHALAGDRRALSCGDDRQLYHLGSPSGSHCRALRPVCSLDGSVAGPPGHHDGSGDGPGAGVERQHVVPGRDDNITYSAGAGLTLNGTTFSVVTSTV